MGIAAAWMLSVVAVLQAQSAWAQSHPTRPIRLIIGVPPGRSVKELIALAKAKPGTLHFYSSGSGGMPHLVGEMFKAATGSPIVHVPYKGSGPGVIDLAAGHVQLAFDSLPSIFPHVPSGRVKLLATVGKNRSSKYPELPSLAEVGYPQVDGKVWYGISGPAGIPQPVVSRLSVRI